MSVRLSERISVALEGPLSAKVDVGEFYDNMARNNWTKTSVVLHEQLRTFHCCRQCKFAITAPLCRNTQYVSIAPGNIAEQHTQKGSVPRPHSNSSYTIPPQC